ncbi:MAG: SgrR family transcriptional regulator [Brevibacillus sp.]|nr:SgrR family transcriptional regulator [Brevibacillus sp.]
MQLLEHYLRLFRASSGDTVPREVEISLREIAAILCCTDRNAKLVLHKMERLQWLCWQPGRGRGHRSSLTFCVTPQDLLVHAAMEQVQKGEIQSARAFVKKWGDEYPTFAGQFQRWLQSQFGWHVSRQGKRRVDTLRLYLEKPFAILDPAYVLLRSEWNPVSHVCSGLVRYDHALQQVVPDLAYHWEQNESANEWHFYLRKGVLFHHGRQFTADDVRYSLQRLRQSNPESPHRWLAEEVKDVQVLDAFTLRIELHRPNQLFLQFLSKEYLGIVPADYTEQMGDSFARMPVGTGPFRLVRNDDTMLVLEANETYFGERPFLDRIEYRFMPKHERKGIPEAPEIRYTPPTAPVVGRTERSDPQRTAETPTCLAGREERAFQYLSLNANKPGPTQSWSFRAALKRILDPAVLIAELGGSREPADVEGTAGMNTGGSQSIDPEGREKVTRLLRESDYRGAALQLFTFPDEDHREDAEWIRQRCRLFGVNLEISYVTPVELASPALLKEADLVLDSANMDKRKELSLLEFLYSGVGSLRYHLPAAMLSELRRQVSRLLACPIDPERSHLADVIWRRLLKEHLFLPLYRNRVNVLVDPRLRGIHLNSYGWIDCRQVFVTR